MFLENSTGAEKVFKKAEIFVILLRIKKLFFDAKLNGFINISIFQNSANDWRCWNC